ncbi:MAG: amidohydrolase [Chloroflexi bacterium]|nr:amidohydrolase [Chloroflexota bacterium]
MSGIDDLKARVCAAVDAWAERLWDTSLTIHQAPELGYAEYRTAERLCALLVEGGLPVERGIAEMPTAFRATVAGQVERPCVAILAEMDALPGLGHACGHNLIGTAAVGAGLGLATVAADLPGSAVVLGCPAEESAVDDSGGKIRLLRAGAFAAVDAAIMVHPGTLDLVSMSTSLAACGLEFEFIGQAAHAALAPDQGINALDGVLHTFSGINALRQHLPPSARVHGIITHGGTSPNIVPDRAVCRFRVRANGHVELSAVAEKVTNCARAGALASGARLVVRETTPVYAEMRPNAAVAEALFRNLAAVGRPVCTSSPDERRGSTDFGNVSQVIPAACASVAIADDTVAIHSPAFAAAAAAEPARRMLVDSAKALAMTAIDLLLGSPKTPRA